MMAIIHNSIYTGNRWLSVVSVGSAGSLTLLRSIQTIEAEGGKGRVGFYCSILFPRREATFLKMLEKNGGDDGTRTRGLCRDSEQFISICKDLQEHGRHPKSLQDSLRHRYCVLRCVPRPEGNRSYGSRCLDRICVPRQRRRNKRSEGTVRTFLCDRRYASNAVATANTLARFRVFSPLDNQ